MEEIIKVVLENNSKKEILTYIQSRYLHCYLILIFYFNIFSIMRLISCII